MTGNEQLQQEIALYTNGGLLITGVDAAAFTQQLAQYINGLITTNFSKLIYLLYRLDISEQKLKQLLAGQPQTDAGLLIANMMIERQQQKIQLRKQFKTGSNNISEEERW